MSETLRLELAPFGVKVITGMLGHIESKIHDNDSWRGLPESSRYKAVEEQIAKTAEGKIGPKLEKVDDFARRFVADILGGATGQVWRGAGAQSVRAIGYHAPTSIIVRVKFMKHISLTWQVEVLLTNATGLLDLTRKWIECHGKGCCEKVKRTIKKSMSDWLIEPSTISLS